MKTLYSWIGDTDRKAIKQQHYLECALGSILSNDKYDELILIADTDEEVSPKADRTKQATEKLVSILQKQFSLKIEVDYIDLENPTDFSGIYTAALAAMEKQNVFGSEPTSMDFNVTSGTPQMSLIWHLIGIQFNGRMLQHSKEAGVAEIDFPFEIKSEFISKDQKDAIGQEALEQSNKLLGTVLISSLDDYGEIAFSSDSMRSLHKQALKASSHSFPVYLAGEIGTEKVSIAKLIHKESEHHDGNFIHVNCSAENEHTMDRQIFGEKDPMFQGGRSDNKIKPFIEQATNGTLYLEDVEKLSRQAQQKLCGLLATADHKKPNSRNKKLRDVRIITSSSVDLVEAVRKGQITEEFYFLASVLKIRVPSLSERKNDLGKIATNLLDRVNANMVGAVGFTRKHFSPSALAYIENNEWPGNLIELHSLIKRVAVTVEDPVIKYDDILDAVLISPKQNRRDDKILNRKLGDGFDINDTIREVVHHYLRRADEQAAGNKTAAAKLLELPSRQAFAQWYDRMKKFENEKNRGSDA